MSIHINWGSPGSYKTSHSVLESIPILLSSNRFFVTNVRGFSIETAFDNFGADYPNFIIPTRKERFLNVSRLTFDDVFDVSRIDTLLRFFPLWLPFGAYFLFDEVQLVFPKNFSQKEFTASFSDLNVPSWNVALSTRLKV